MSILVKESGPENMVRIVNILRIWIGMSGLTYSN